MAGGRRTRKDIEELAKKTLIDHGLYACPVNPVVVARRLGATVQNAVFSEARFAGVTAQREAGLSILVKESDPPLRKRFTIAHEIGHVLLHLDKDTTEIIDSDADFFRLPPSESEGWTEERHREIDANVFAAALLMPAGLVREIWSDMDGAGRSVEVMASLFQVSEEAMGYRLAGLRLANG